MRVLWFTNTPSNAAAELGGASGKGGGWISSLETLVTERTSIELGVAFFYPLQEDKKIVRESVTYFAVALEPQNALTRIKDRFLLNLQADSKIFRLLQIVDEFKPDLIHVFGSEEVFGMIAKYVNTPVVLHIQGVLEACIQNWFPRGVSNWDVLRRSPLSETIRGTGTYFDYRFMSKMARREREIFSHCKYYMGRTYWDQSVSRLLAPGSDYFHCDEMIRPVFLENRWSPPPSDSPVVISTTINPNIYKGLDIVLKTARLLKEQARLSFVWNVFGIHKNHALVRLYEKLLKDSFRHYPVIFHGPVDANQLVENLCGSHLFVHSSHIDNSPNSVCEAMLLGMPVVAANTGGVSSLLEDGVEGILYPDNDQYLLARHIMDLAASPERAAELGKKARERARARHDQDAILNQLQSIYKQILAKANTRISSLEKQS